MAQHDAAGMGVGGGGPQVGGIRGGIQNVPDMVAEPGAQLPVGQIGGGLNSGGGQQVPIPVGGTPEMLRGRNRSRSSNVRWSSEMGRENGITLQSTP